MNITSIGTILVSVGGVVAKIFKSKDKVEKHKITEEGKIRNRELDTEDKKIENDYKSKQDTKNVIENVATEALKGTTQLGTETLKGAVQTVGSTIDALSSTTGKGIDALSLIAGETIKGTTLTIQELLKGKIDIHKMKFTTEDKNNKYKQKKKKTKIIEENKTERDNNNRKIVDTKEKHKTKRQKNKENTKKFKIDKSVSLEIEKIRNDENQKTVELLFNMLNIISSKKSMDSKKMINTEIHQLDMIISTLNKEIESIDKIGLDIEIKQERTKGALDELYIRYSKKEGAFENMPDNKQIIKELLSIIYDLETREIELLKYEKDLKNTLEDKKIANEKLNFLNLKLSYLEETISKIDNTIDTTLFIEDKIRKITNNNFNITEVSQKLISN